jgi:hypothetical protein
MLVVLVKIPSIHILQALSNNVLLDKVPVWCHTLMLPALMLCPQRFLVVPSPQNSLQISIVLTNLHLAAHLSYICGECKLECSES